MGLSLSGIESPMKQTAGEILDEYTRTYTIPWFEAQINEIEISLQPYYTNGIPDNKKSWVALQEAKLDIYYDAIKKMSNTK